MERCWHGKFGGDSQCSGEGLYGNPDYRYRRDRPGLDTFVAFMRAARWCAAHKNPGDRLLEPREKGTTPGDDAGPSGGDAAR
jgi:imidazolonepropionase-like amidohydrolase